MFWDTRFMGNRLYIKNKRLSLALQAARLRSLYPSANCQITRNHLRWKGTLNPTPLSNNYVVKLSYSLGESPKTYVVSPQLSIPTGERLPHVYNQKNQRLCLYYPGEKSKWNPLAYLAETIVPWASEWLFYYELWLSTGEWLGGGIHLSKKKN